jgi:hypothetical protein
MVNSEDPEPKPDQNKFDLSMVSLNSTRGVLAGAAMSLYCRWLELHRPIPRLLPPLLRRFASDLALGVRVSILNRLPFLVHHDPGLGWALFGEAFREPQGVLWVEAERLLYYNYRHSFERVAPLLARIGNEAPEVAGHTLGRLATLSYLAGHPVTDDRHLSALATTDSIREGITQVLAANLDSYSTRAKCRTALIAMLHEPESSRAAVVALGRAMASDNDDGAVDPELVHECARALSPAGRAGDTWGMCKWLERNCGRYPLVALEVCEQLAALGGEQASARFSTGMVPVLLAILKEADETDDPELIARAVKLQDHFLKLGVHGMDELLDKSTLS